jgi:hypothetical protein
MLPCERKSVEPMAALTAPERTAAQHQSLLHFVGNAARSDERVLAKVREMGASSAAATSAPALSKISGWRDGALYPLARGCRALDCIIIESLHNPIADATDPLGQRFRSGRAAADPMETVEL